VPGSMLDSGDVVSKAVRPLPSRSSVFVVVIRTDTKVKCHCKL
jgi:hypothetical protein